MRRSDGFILLYVVALIAAISLILFQLNLMKSAAPNQLERQVSRAVETHEARLLLDFVTTGLVEQTLSVDPRYLAFRRLLLDDPARLAEMEDALAQLKAMLDALGFDIGLGKNNKGNAGGAFRHDGKGILFSPRIQPYPIVLGDHEYAVRVTPGNALPDLNGLPYDAMWRYLKFLGVTEPEARDLAAALIDWRDADNFLTDARGAEDNYYASLKAPFTPRNAPFRNWQELAYVRGVGSDRLQLIREHFTLGQDSPRVLIDYVSPEILAELSGLRLDIVKSILTEYGRLHTAANPNSGREVAEVLMTQDAAAFDALAAWQPDLTRVRIDISGPGSRLTADYDMVKKRLLAWW